MPTNRTIRERLEAAQETLDRVTAERDQVRQAITDARDAARSASYANDDEAQREAVAEAQRLTKKYREISHEWARQAAIFGGLNNGLAAQMMHGQSEPTLA